MPARKPRRARARTSPRAASSARAGRSRSSAPSKGSLVFARGNYVLMLVGLAFVVVGYVLMRAENEVDGFLSLYVAPLLILGGYLEIIYAIMWRPKEEPAEAAQAAEA